MHATLHEVDTDKMQQLSSPAAQLIVSENNYIRFLFIPAADEVTAVDRKLMVMSVDSALQ